MVGDEGTKYSNFVRDVEDRGLKIFGYFQLRDHLSSDHIWAAKHGLLIGNAGRDMWEAFSKSEIFADRQPDRLNRWTSQNLSSIARKYNADPIYPFGDPVWPFQQFAKSALNIEASPLGLLVHPQYGLWHAYRGGLLFDGDHSILLAAKAEMKRGQLNKQSSPCNTCSGKPCMTTCPVGAFTENGLEVANCFRHLDHGENPKCMETGCRAREACPVGAEFQYSAEQIRFHMAAYRGR